MAKHKFLFLDYQLPTLSNFGPTYKAHGPFQLEMAQLQAWLIIAITGQTAQPD
jgi:hypothetical protein